MTTVLWLRNRNHHSSRNDNFYSIMTSRKKKKEKEKVAMLLQQTEQWWRIPSPKQHPCLYQDYDHDGFFIVVTLREWQPNLQYLFPCSMPTSATCKINSASHWRPSLIEFFVGVQTRLGCERPFEFQLTRLTVLVKVLSRRFASAVLEIWSVSWGVYWRWKIEDREQSSIAPFGSMKTENKGEYCQQ